MLKIEFPDENSLHVLKKLSEAVRALVTGAGRIQERLAEAEIYLIGINAENIPDDNLRRMLAGIVDDLTLEQARRAEGRRGAAVQILHAKDASAIAGHILETYQRLDDTQR
jgi:hypothetical protein